MTARKSGSLWLVAILFAALWFGTLEYRKLVKPDEGRYGEIPREMVATGDWLTPRLNGIKYFEKPPLQYWATAAAFDPATRLPHANSVHTASPPMSGNNMPSEALAICALSSAIKPGLWHCNVRNGSAIASVTGPSA